MMKYNIRIVDLIMEKYNVKSKMNNLKRYLINIEEFKNIKESISKEIRKSINNIILECILFDYQELKEIGIIIGIDRQERLSFFEENILTNDYLNEFFIKYPLLDKTISLKINDIFDAYLKIIISYHADAEWISKKFNYRYGQIKDIDISAGDIHYGKTVARVTLQKGILYFKPRQMISDELFEDLCYFMNDGIKSGIDLKIPKYYIKDDHSWQEYIIQKHCTKMEEVHNYYYRCGVYLSLFFVLGTNDLHCENVIAYGEYPIFIDLETIAQGVNTEYSINCGFKDIKASVLNTALLPLRRADDLLDINVSGLFTDTKASKSKYIDVLIPDDEYDWAFEKRPIRMSEKSNLVYLNDALIKPNTVKNDILTGFDDGIKHIINCKTNFIKIIESYRDKNLITRIILRPTSVYGKFINALHHPDSLTSKSQHDNIINIFVEGFELGKFGYLRLEKEIEALEHGYIPAFEFNLFSKDIFSNNKVVCENYFMISAFDNILMKLEKIDMKMIEYQTSLIEMSLIMPYAKNEIQNIDQRNNDSILDEEKYIQELCIFLDRISERTFIIGNDSASIVFLELGKENYFINELNSSMYNSGGLIWLLATAGKNYQNQTYLSTAEKMMQFINDNFKYMKLQNIMDKNLSIYTGIGGLAYLNYNLYKLTNKSHFRETYLYVQNSILDDLHTREFTIDDLDHLYGITSIITFLCKVYLDNRDDKLKQALSKLYNKFVSIVTDNWKDMEAGYAHGFTSVYCCLSYLINICNKKTDLNIIQEMIDTENKTLNSLNMSWCKGHAGVILARFTTDKNLQTNYTVDYLNFDTQSFIDHQKELCLCHGIYGNIDILITLVNNNLIESLDGINRSYYNNLNAIKLFKENDYIWESFMLGVSGIAYVTLRQFNHSLPSVIGLDIYED